MSCGWSVPRVVTARISDFRKTGLSGGLSPYLTQRIVGRLASTIAGADTHHLPAAGHLLPLTHGKLVNPLILAHISRADDLASVSLASILQPCAFVATGQELESSTAPYEDH